MRKKKAAAFTIIAALILIYFVGSGFSRNGSSYIEDYSISEDGSEITMDIASAAGYMRKAEVHQQYGGKLYLDCYFAFGGINGSIGKKTSFTFPLDEDTTVIAVYRNINCYEEVLFKDADGVWQRK